MNIRQDPAAMTSEEPSMTFEPLAANVMLAVPSFMTTISWPSRVPGFIIMPVTADAGAYRADHTPVTLITLPFDMLIAVDELGVSTIPLSDLTGLTLAISFDTVIV